MEINDKTVYFKSTDENYKNELADKCFTIRELSGQELKDFVNSDIKKIVIINTETGESFERCIIGRMLWRKGTGKRENNTSYRYQDWAIWWAPEQKRRGRKHRIEEAVEEKRM